VATFHDLDDNGVSVMCPKFVAFTGPYSGRKSRGPTPGPTPGARALEPSAYVPALQALGVSDVVLLNEASSYNAGVFEQAGMTHHHLEFTDCSSPNLAIVQEIMRVCNEAKSVVAVHCLAGLGRTGTLIGLWLMGNLGWGARESIGWLRLVRPGSVIGGQQHFLVTIEIFARGSL